MCDVILDCILFTAMCHSSHTSAVSLTLTRTHAALSRHGARLRQTGQASPPSVVCVLEILEGGESKLPWSRYLRTQAGIQIPALDKVLQSVTK